MYQSSLGNKHSIVFVDYLTKWPEVFPAKDQWAYTIAKILVEKIIPKHGVPAQVLSDHGTAHLSNLLAEVYQLMGMNKLNTTAYHPWNDGLVERFNHILLEMLAKSAKQNGKDWDICLPFILFPYCASPQTSDRGITILPTVHEGPQVAHRSCPVPTTKFSFSNGF